MAAQIGMMVGSSYDGILPSELSSLDGKSPGCHGGGVQKEHLDGGAVEVGDRVDLAQAAAKDEPARETVLLTSEVPGTEFLSVLLVHFTRAADAASK